MAIEDYNKLKLKIKELKKEIYRLNIGLETQRQRQWNLEKKIEKIEAKRELNYNELVKTLLDHLEKARKQTDYGEIIKMILEGKKPE